MGGLLVAKFVGSLLINLILVHCLKLSDFYVMLVSFITYTGLFISLAASTKDWQIYSGIFISHLSLSTILVQTSFKIG